MQWRQLGAAFPDGRLTRVDLMGVHESQPKRTLMDGDRDGNKQEKAKPSQNIRKESSCNNFRMNIRERKNTERGEEKQGKTEDEDGQH
jgi:hypothetical protein